MLYRGIALSILALILSGCVQYSLVEPGPVQVKEMNISTNIPWNKAPAVSKPGPKTEMWTTDGPLLNALIFFSGVGDGEHLFNQKSRKDPMPTFSKDMLPHDVVSLAEASMTKHLGAGDVLVKSKNLKPIMLNGQPGFRFNMDFYNVDGLAFQSDMVCSIKEDKLYAVLYLGTELHYYDNYKDEVEHIFNTLAF